MIINKKEEKIVSINYKYQVGSSLSDSYIFINELINDYKFDKAFFIYDQIKKSTLFNNEKLDLKQKEIFNDLEATYKEIIFIANLMDYEDDWIIEKAGSCITLKYKKVPNSRLYTLKNEALLDFPIYNLCAMIYEIDLFKEWVPFCKASSTIKKVSKAFKIAYFLLELPFISNREAYIKGIGVDRLDENGTFLILSGTIDENPEFQKKYDVNIPEYSNNVRLGIINCGMEIRPINRNKFEARIICSSDPKIAYIPDFVINFCVRKGGVYMFEKLMQHAKNLEGTKWEDRMKGTDDQDFYKWVENRLDIYFKSKNL